MNNYEKSANPLGTQRVGVLLRRFATPSIIAMLVGALYNIVDQFFIGNRVGELGNAATNIAFPLSTSCVAIALLFGIGGASLFNLEVGRGNTNKAIYYIGNASVLLFVCGLILCFITQLFLEPMLVFFGSPVNVLGYAKTYTRITSFGFPFLIFATGAGHLIRADGSPKMTMICNLTGAVINTVLDAIFVFGLDLKMAGAAVATVIGQIVSALIAVIYMTRFKTESIKKEHLILRWEYIKKLIAYGLSPFSNQVAMMIVQIIMNKSLKYYGSISEYGESIPIACSGIISKVNMVFFSFIIGISQGLQPIVSFNYGAGKYGRVKQAYMLAIKVGFALSLVAFILFEVFPHEIISAFGNGSDLYYSFATSYFRIFLFFTFLNFLQPITSNSFTAIGKPLLGVFLSLTRQILFLLPLIVILPIFMGMDGILYAGPIADFFAFIICAIMIRKEFAREEYTEKM